MVYLQTSISRLIVLEGHLPCSKPGIESPCQPRETVSVFTVPWVTPTYNLLGCYTTSIKNRTRRRLVRSMQPIFLPVKSVQNPHNTPTVHCRRMEQTASCRALHLQAQYRSQRRLSRRLYLLPQSYWSKRKISRVSLFKINIGHDIILLGRRMLTISEVKAQLEEMTSIHIYSLEPGPLEVRYAYAHVGMLLLINFRTYIFYQFATRKSLRSIPTRTP